MVKVDLSGAKSFFIGNGPDYSAAAAAHKVLAERTGAGADFLGWPVLPAKIRETELDRIVAAADKIRYCSRFRRIVPHSTVRPGPSGQSL